MKVYLIVLPLVLALLLYDLYKQASIQDEVDNN